MPGPLFDCYVLAPSRTAEAATAFLNRFMPEGEPQFDPADPSEVLGLRAGASVSEISDFLEANPRVAYSLYWTCRGPPPPYSALLAFTSDAHLILGLSPCFDDEPERARSVLLEMLTFTGATHGYIAVEEPPASDREQFIRTTKARGGSCSER